METRVNVTGEMLQRLREGTLDPDLQYVTEKIQKDVAYRTVSRMNQDQQEDLRQDCWVALIKYIEDKDLDEVARYWTSLVGRISYNQAVERCRYAKYRAGDCHIGDFKDVDIDRRDPSDQFTEVDRKEIVDRLLDMMPARVRRIAIAWTNEKNFSVACRLNGWNNYRANITFAKWVWDNLEELERLDPEGLDEERTARWRRISRLTKAPPPKRIKESK